MEFFWKYNYVKEGETTPDKWNRWALVCYMKVDSKALPEYNWREEHMYIRLATMTQKGTVNANVASITDKYAVQIPTFWDAGNTGLSYMYFYSNDIEELKKITEDNFIKMQTIFKNS